MKAFNVYDGTTISRNYESETAKHELSWNDREQNKTEQQAIDYFHILIGINSNSNCS